MVRLFTSYYNEPNAKRASELRECLQRNLNSGVFDTIHLLLENTAPPLTDQRLQTRRIDYRPTYADFFKWQRELCVDQSELTVIANSDIYFDQSLLALEREKSIDTCYALSRWNCLADGNAMLYDHNDSQDAWIFRGAIKEELYGDFRIGVPRCDNRMLYELQKAGYRVLNPAFSIRSHHLHVEERKPYTQTNQSHFVEPPYRYLWPHNLWSLPRTLIHNALSPDRKVFWRLDQRKINGMLPVRIVRKARRSFLKAS